MNTDGESISYIIKVLRKLFLNYIFILFKLDVLVLVGNQSINGVTDCRTELELVLGCKLILFILDAELSPKSKLGVLSPHFWRIF